MVDHLLERGYRVRVIDNMTGGHERNLAHHARDPGLSVERADIRALNPDAPLFAGARYVFHFAGIGDIVPSIEKPTEYMDTNVQGTCGCSNVRAMPGRRNSSMRRRRPATASPVFRPPKTIRSIRNTPTRCRNISASSRRSIGTRFTACQ